MRKKKSDLLARQDKEIKNVFKIGFKKGIIMKQYSETYKKQEGNFHE